MILPRNAHYILAWLALVACYGVLCYFSLSAEWGRDFASYYASAKQLAAGGNPYIGKLFVDYAGVAHVPLSGNPNPPITLWLFSVFSYLPYPIAFMAWLSVSTLLGIIGVYQTLACVSPHLLEKGGFMRFLWVYFASFPVLANTIMLQFGGVLLFLLMQGYRAYGRHQDGRAAGWWGMLIACKLFPGLLVLYTFIHKRYRLCVMMSGVAIGLTLLPLWVTHGTVYRQYMQSITHRLSWYETNWNLSYVGWLYRRFVLVSHDKVTDIYSQLWLVSERTISLLYGGGALLILGIWCFYSRRLERASPHQGFAIVILLMLFLSPLAWLYYFPLLLLPLLCTLSDGVDRSWRLGGWFVTFMLLCMPIPALRVIEQPLWWVRWGIYSIHGYGFLGLVYLTCTLDPQSNPHRLTWEGIPLVLKRGILAVIASGFLIISLRIIGKLWVGKLWF